MMYFSYSESEVDEQEGPALKVDKGKQKLLVNPSAAGRQQDASSYVSRRRAATRSSTDGAVVSAARSPSPGKGRDVRARDGTPSKAADASVSPPQGRPDADGRRASKAQAQGRGGGGPSTTTGDPQADTTPASTPPPSVRDKSSRATHGRGSSSGAAIAPSLRSTRPLDQDVRPASPSLPPPGARTRSASAGGHQGSGAPMEAGKAKGIPRTPQASPQSKGTATPTQGGGASVTPPRHTDARVQPPRSSMGKRTEVRTFIPPQSNQGGDEEEWTSEYGFRSSVSEEQGEGSTGGLLDPVDSAFCEAGYSSPGGSDASQSSHSAGESPGHSSESSSEDLGGSGKRKRAASPSEPGSEKGSDSEKSDSGRPEAMTPAKRYYLKQKDNPRTQYLNRVRALQQRQRKGGWDEAKYNTHLAGMQERFIAEHKFLPEGVKRVVSQEGGPNGASPVDAPARALGTPFPPSEKEAISAHLDEHGWVIVKFDLPEQEWTDFVAQVHKGSGLTGAENLPHIAQTTWPPVFDSERELPASERTDWGPAPADGPAMFLSGRCIRGRMLDCKSWGCNSARPFTKALGQQMLGVFGPGQWAANTAMVMWTQDFSAPHQCAHQEGEHGPLLTLTSLSECGFHYVVFPELYQHFGKRTVSDDEPLLPASVVTRTAVRYLHVPCGATLVSHYSLPHCGPSDQFNARYIISWVPEGCSAPPENYVAAYAACNTFRATLEDYRFLCASRPNHMDAADALVALGSQEAKEKWDRSERQAFREYLKAGGFQVTSYTANKRRRK
jgi:hypothetical protein